MIFRYIKCQHSNSLIQHFYELQVMAEDTPIVSSILPTAQCHIIHVDSKFPIEIEIKNDSFKNKGTVVLGQSYKSYLMKTNTSFYNFGISLHPTAIYKLFGEEASSLTDKHVPLKTISKKLYNQIHPLFEAKHDADTLAKLLEDTFLNLPLFEDKNTEHIDNAITLIYKKEGLISVDEVLGEIPISQKNLQMQFKKIVGLTPIKFIKLYKFLSLMKKYESESAKITDLINYYEYYDLSHFTKDFKLFMNEQPKNYFKKEHEFIKNYLFN